MRSVAVILGTFTAGLLLGGGLGAVIMAWLAVSRLTDEETAAEMPEQEKYFSPGTRPCEK